jgi:hypothetical protein
LFEPTAPSIATRVGASLFDRRPFINSMLLHPLCVSPPFLSEVSPR